MCGLIQSLPPTRLRGERRLTERQAEAGGDSWASPVEVTLKIGGVLMLQKMVMSAFITGPQTALKNRHGLLQDDFLCLVTEKGEFSERELV